VSRPYAHGIFELVAIALISIGCQVTSARVETQSPHPPETTTAPSRVPQRPIRATGTIRAIREHVVQVPRIQGQSGRMILTWLVANGAVVAKDDVVAEFDRTEQRDKAREALGKFEDLQHQVEQRQAENRANAARRGEALEQVRAELAKASLQLRISEVLAEIERLKNEVKVKDASAHVASLEESQRQREIADQADLRILELKMERQRVALDRSQANAEKLVVLAPFGGMLAHEHIWRSGSMGPPQVGDQLYRGQPLLRIFDPTEMEVHLQVGEPDGAVLTPVARALVSLDAYPDLLFKARLTSASPVAAAALGSPIRRFEARFALEATDPHLLPDLSAAVIVYPDGRLPEESNGP
jgi:HlyD family secretion protein